MLVKGSVSEDGIYFHLFANINTDISREEDGDVIRESIEQESARRKE